jgi:hypothetical protein
MKYLSILFLLIVFSLQGSFGQSKKYLEQKEFENFKLELKDSLSLIRNNFTEKQTYENDKRDILNDKLEESANTISYLNSVIGTYGIILTVLGLFIAVIALIVPFVTYQYAVKPSREALKDLEKNFDSRLEQYLWDNRNKQINKAIDNIRNGNAEEKSQSIAFLTFTHSEGLTDEQLFQIYNILRKNQSDYSIKSQLSFILSSRRTDYATELFNSSEINKDPVIKQMAMLYFAKTGFKNNYEGLMHIIGDKANQEINFNSFIGDLHQYNSADVNEAINDTQLIDLLSSQTLKKLEKSFPVYIKNLSMDIKFDNSYLSEKIKTNA